MQKDAIATKLHLITLNNYILTRHYEKPETLGTGTVGLFTLPAIIILITAALINPLKEEDGLNNI
jgi:hypothetical protein